MTDPLALTAIFAEHRRLLAHLRDFMGMIREEGGRDPLSLVAALAFLRQEVLAFAHWEEHALEEDPGQHETASFEHAFLTVEVQAMATEVEELRRAGAEMERDPDRFHEVRERAMRRIYRIEALLELHILRAEDHGILV
jgi:hypothetical protein